MTDKFIYRKQVSVSGKIRSQFMQICDACRTCDGAKFSSGLGSNGDEADSFIKVTPAGKDSVCAYCAVYRLDECTLVYPYIHPEFRRNGIFIKMLKKIRHDRSFNTPLLFYGLCEHPAILHMMHSHEIEMFDKCQTMTLDLGKTKPAAQNSIRIYQENDTALLSAFHSQIFDGFTPKTSRQYIDILIDNENPSFFLLKQDNETVGMVCITISNTTACISAFGILPELRGKGLGMKCLERVLKFLKHSSDLVTLHVDSSNIKAVSLYEKTGFEVKNTLCTYEYV